MKPAKGYTAAGLIKHIVTRWAVDLYFLITKEEQPFFVLTPMSKKNTMHRIKVGNNKVLNWWLGQEKENGLTADLSWCALSEFISSSLCYFPLPISFLQNGISEVLPPFSFPDWAWQKCKHLGRRLKISLWKQWRKELQFTCLYHLGQT